MEFPKILKIFIGYLFILFGGCVLLVLVALTGSETLTYGLVALLVAVTFAFLFSTNMFAQEK